MLRRIFVIMLAVGLPIAASTEASFSPAVAGGLPVSGTGFVSCSSVTGALKFSPGLNATGGSAEVLKVKLALAGCTTTNSNVTTPTFGGSAKGTLTTASNNCLTDLEGTMSVLGDLSIKWSAKVGTSKLTPTVVTLSSITGVAVTGSSDVQLSFANQASTGSFNSRMAGQMISNETATGVASSTGCNATKGLKRLPIASGTLTSKDVLTAGGRDVAVGDVLTASNGTSSGPLYFCSGGGITATVTSNPIPLSSPLASASVQVSAMSLANCYDLVGGIPSEYFPVVFTTPATLYLADDGSLTIPHTGIVSSCGYSGGLVGSFTNSTSTIATTSAGSWPLGAGECSESLSLSLTFGPLMDTSVSPPEPVAVNGP